MFLLPTPTPQKRQTRVLRVKIKRRGWEAGSLEPEEAWGHGKMGSYQCCILRMSRFGGGSHLDERSLWGHLLVLSPITVFLGIPWLPAISSMEQWSGPS